MADAGRAATLRSSRGFSRIPRGPARTSVPAMGDELRAQDLRVSHAEREHVARLLSEHFAEGRLTVDEYGERSAAATEAVTRADLNRLLMDLPGAEVARRRELLELVTTGGDLTRKGEWLVPARIVVRSRFGNASLDFRSARFSVPVVALEFDLTFGNLELRVPKGTTVDLEDARTGFGEVKDKIGPSLERGNPHLVVVGRTRVGNVRVRH
ncbi:protein of unknown function [Pseudonocardia oroxyli]|uniref:DUF1707 domain-containing protein n=2 Tax=Pseudonocardia oroxyli TaxID=366584 RepID=A0A1G7LKX4_PSEOR|nr:protein of unknown function [Pseudonocardia oroxyli]